MSKKALLLGSVILLGCSTGSYADDDPDVDIESQQFSNDNCVDGYTQDCINDHCLTSESTDCQSQCAKMATAQCEEQSDD